MERAKQVVWSMYNHGSPEVEREWGQAAIYVKSYVDVCFAGEVWV